MGNIKEMKLIARCCGGGGGDLDFKKEKKREIHCKELAKKPYE